MSRATLCLVLSGTLGSLPGCSDVVDPSELNPAALALVAGDSQTTTVSSPVDVRPAVRVVNVRDRPVPGVTVTFAVASGGGSVTGATALTDGAGLAKVGAWTLGTATGPNTLTASVAGLPPVTFTAVGTAGLPTQVIPLSDTAQIGTAGLPVPIRPAVRVADAQDNPVPRVRVTFAVKDGRGRVAGATAVTDTSGLAMVGSWTLGTTSGPNTLTAAVEGVPPVAFTVIGMAGPATGGTRQPDSTLVGTVASAVPVPPALRVADEYGNPVAGVTVTFAVATGGGSVTGNTTVTGVDGLAAVGAWILGPTAGFNTITAAAAGLQPLTFAAIGRAGPPAIIVKALGDGQTGGVGRPVDTLPTVVVRDAYGNPAAGVVVTFAVVSGAGEITGPLSETDASGTARVGSWTLGPDAGVDTLTATVTGLPPVTFTATAVDRCAEATPYALGSTVTGTLSADDCRFPSGAYADLYATTIGGTASVRFDMTGSADFSSHVSLFDASGTLVASSPFCLGGFFDEWAPLYCPTASVQVLLAPGNYIAGAWAIRYDAGWNVVGGVGPYTISSTPVAEDVTGCRAVYIMPGVTTAQRIDPSDCTATFRTAEYFSDVFWIQLLEGQTVTITMASGSFDTFLEIIGMGSQAVNDDFGGTSNSQITLTAPASGLYTITAGTYRENATGAYTLSLR